jgi:hypothetical protein
MEHCLGNTRKDQAEINARKKEIERDSSFYSGQQKYHWGYKKTLEEHEKRNEYAKVFGPIARPPQETYQFNPFVPKPITIEEMNQMSTAEAAKPLLAAAFTSLLEYSLEGPHSRKTLSGWVKSPEEHIDSSPAGNKSCFGEDWGAPPKQ